MAFLDALRGYIAKATQGEAGNVVSQRIASKKKEAARRPGRAGESRAMKVADQALFVPTGGFLKPGNGENAQTSPQERTLEELTKSHNGSPSPAFPQQKADMPQRDARRDNALARVSGPTDKDWQVIRAWRGELLNKEGTTMATAIPAKFRRHILYLDVGYVLVDQVISTEASLKSILERMVRTARADRREKFPTKICWLDLNEIDKIRGFSSLATRRELSKKIQVRGADAQPMQKEIMEIFGMAAAVSASDVYFYVEERTTIKWRELGRVSVTMIKDKEWGKAAGSAVFEMCAAGSRSSASYDVQEMPRGQINRLEMPDLMPSSLDAVRVQIAPLPMDGILAVFRLVNAASKRKKNVNSTGYRKCHIDDLNAARRKREGATIIAGPTGSGKSSTLTAILEEDVKNNPSDHYLTLETPIEAIVAGVGQIAIVDPTRLDEATRQTRLQRAGQMLMRLDPDVIVVGEARTPEDAKLVIELANSGHRVLSTTHTISANAIPSRFRDLGVPPHDLLMPGKLTCLVGQRLVPRLCPHCSVKMSDLGSRTDTVMSRMMVVGPDFDKLKALEEKAREIMQTNKVAGVDDGGIRIDRKWLLKPGEKNECPHCRGTGLSGRTVVAETIRVNNDYIDYLRREDLSGAIKYWLDEGGGLMMGEHMMQHLVCGSVDLRDFFGVVGEFGTVSDNRLHRVLGDLMA